MRMTDHQSRSLDRQWNAAEDRRDSAREVLARIEPVRWFRIREGTTTLQVLQADNGDDPDLRDWAERAEVGDKFTRRDGRIVECVE